MKLDVDVDKAMELDRRKIKPKPTPGLSLSLNRSRSADDFNNAGRATRTTSGNGNGGGGGGIFFTTKSCASCGHPLGLFLSRGYVCHKCGFKVCKKCKIYEQNSSGWSCMKCTRTLWKKGVGGDSMVDGGRDDGSRVKRSWSISGPGSGNSVRTKTNTGSSPILKSYVQYKVEDDKQYEFQFHSLPRMPTNTTKKIFARDAQKAKENRDQAQLAQAAKKRRSHSTTWLGVDHQSTTAYDIHDHDEQDSHDHEFASHPSTNTQTIHSFQTTLHPFTSGSTQAAIHGRKSSPASSVKFIEDEFWDYYDYRIAAAQAQAQAQERRGGRSNRSSCERSLCETVVDVQQHCLCFEPAPMSMSMAVPAPHPQKPERLRKGGGGGGAALAKSLSMGSYDAKAKYSQLKTYCLVRRKDSPNNRQPGSEDLNGNLNLNGKHNHVKDDDDEQFDATYGSLLVHVHDDDDSNTGTAKAEDEKENKPTPTPRTKRRQALLARLVNEAVVWRDNKGNPILGGTLPKNYKQTINISSANNEPFGSFGIGVGVNDSFSPLSLSRKDAAVARSRNAAAAKTKSGSGQDAEDEKSVLLSLPYGNTSCSCQTGQNCDWDSKSDVGDCQHVRPGWSLPSKPNGAGPGLQSPQSPGAKCHAQASNIVNSDPLSEFKVTVENRRPSTSTGSTSASAVTTTTTANSNGKGDEPKEIWQQKLRQLKQDYNMMNKSGGHGRSLINYVDIKHNTALPAGREIVIPIKSERERELRSDNDNDQQKQKCNVSATNQQQKREEIEGTGARIPSPANQDPSKSININVAELPAPAHVDTDADTLAILQTVSNIEAICANVKAATAGVEVEVSPMEDPNYDTDSFQDCNPWTSGDEQSDDEDTARTPRLADGFKSCEELDDCEYDKASAKGVGIPLLSVQAQEAASASGDFTLALKPASTTITAAAAAETPSSASSVLATCAEASASLASANCLGGAAANCDGLVDSSASQSQTQSQQPEPEQGVLVRLSNQRLNNATSNANNINPVKNVNVSKEPGSDVAAVVVVADSIVDEITHCSRNHSFDVDKNGDSDREACASANVNASPTVPTSAGMSSKKIYKSRVIITADGTGKDQDQDNGIEIVEVAPEQVGIVTVTGPDSSRSSVKVLSYGDTHHVKVTSPVSSVGATTNAIRADEDYRLTPPPDSPDLRRPNTTSMPNLRSKLKSHNESLPNTLHNGISVTKPQSQKYAKANTPESRILAKIQETGDADAIEETDTSTTKLPSADRRESPEGQESLESTKRAEPNKHTMARYAPDGADKSEDIKMCKPVAHPTEDDDGSSTDSWTEEMSFTDGDENAPPPLDLTLHTIVEESCDEYDHDHDHHEHLPESPVKATVNELERYYNFATEGAEPLSLPYEESEFSDTISESSFSSELRNQDQDQDLDDLDSNLLDLAAGRPEKYFMSFGQHSRNSNSDSVGSESDTDTSVSENRKKVLKHHHRRSSEFEDDANGASGSEDDNEFAFEQEGFDTIKKQRKIRRSNEDLLEASVTARPRPEITFAKSILNSNSNATTNPSATISLTPNREFDRIAPIPSPRSSPSPTPSKENAASVSRSNSFTWSSDEEVNLMMSKLRQLVKNLVQNKKAGAGSDPNQPKDEKLIYLESELIRLMRSENIKSIVEHISSDSDDDSARVQRLIEKVDAGASSQPELVNLVMKHIGQRLSTWMKDEDAELTDDAATIKCAASISSDLNEDRFSWKGSFESTLAKRQSVGSSDSLDCGAVTPAEGSDVFCDRDRSILRSSSLHHLANSQPILEESDSLTNSLPRLNNLQTGNIGRARSLVIDQGQVKSARYRPPGYFEAAGSTEPQIQNHNHVSVSTPALKTESSLVAFDGITHMDRSGDRDSATSSGVTVRGQIEFSMQYDYKHSCFEIRVKQCRDLAAVETKRGRSDPYVKVYLLPERSKSSKRKTKIKRNTLNPVFGEVLKFPISLEELETRSLWVSVWHSDLFGKNEFLGQIVLDLRSQTFDDTSYQWYTLGDEDNGLEEGALAFNGVGTDKDVHAVELVLALKWSPRPFAVGGARGDLSVLVKEAKGLKCVKNTHTFPSTFVKCVPLADKSKKQKTSLCRKSLHPSWNTTLTFDNVSSTGLEVSLYSYDLLNHELLHQTRLDSSNELWTDMLRRDKFWVEGLVTFNE